MKRSTLSLFVACAATAATLFTGGCALAQTECSGTQHVTVSSDLPTLTNLVNHYVSGSFDTRDVVQNAIESNGLDSKATLQTGQQITLPKSCS